MEASELTLQSLISLTIFLEASVISITCLLVLITKVGSDPLFIISNSVPIKKSMTARPLMLVSLLPQTT
uniref:Putative secreted protein n=1 Tax=Panstrongylus lignarius TaxID=156445 RepID=A0A224XUT3_9HEMI